MTDRLDIVLVHPLGANWRPGEKDMSRLANIMPPLGLCSLAAWLRRHGRAVAIHDCYAHPRSEGKLDTLLRTRAPRFVGFTTTTSSFPDAVRMAATIKSAYPNALTIFGGVHVSALRGQLLERFPEIDIAIPGEGEETLLEVLKRDGRNLDEVPGVIHRSPDGEARTSAPRPPIENLDTLPFPAYDALDGFPRTYQLPIFNYPRGPGATAVTSRGCPYQCSYCDRSVFGRSFRYHSPEYTLALFKHLNQRFGIRHVNLYDDTFTANGERARAFCEALARSDLPMTFNCAARAEHLDDELLAALRRAGCWMISLGIESGDPELLARHRGGNCDLDTVRERLHAIRAAGIRAKGLFMLGLPGETEATIDRTRDAILNLPLDEINISKFTPFPGSPLYEGLHKSGDFDEKWELMNCLNFVFIPSGLTRDRLEERYRELYRRYFERPRVLLRYVAMLWQSPGSWLRLLRHLPDFLSVRRTFRKQTSDA